MTKEVKTTLCKQIIALFRETKKEYSDLCLFYSANGAYFGACKMLSLALYNNKYSISVVEGNGQYKVKDHNKRKCLYKEAC